jgi:hypothetical protein
MNKGERDEGEMSLRISELVCTIKAFNDTYWIKR